MAILGCGPIGMFTILLSRAFGAVKVIAVDHNKANLAMAKRLGAHETIVVPKVAANVVEADKVLESEIRKLTHEKGVDVVFEMAGPNQSVNNALSIARNSRLFGGRKTSSARPPAFDHPRPRVQAA